VEGNDVVRPEGMAAPEPRSQPTDLAEILRASVAALKSERGQTTKPKPKSRPKTSTSTKPKTGTRGKASA
jgi:non-homologous end joining protein Ku